MGRVEGISISDSLSLYGSLSTFCPGLYKDDRYGMILIELGRNVYWGRVGVDSLRGKV